MMLKDIVKDLVQYLDNISSSSHSSNTTDAKETSTKIDQKKEENVDVELLEKKVELKQEGEFVILEEANKEESFANDDPWFSDYLSVLDSSVPANGDKEEALPMSSTSTANPNPIDTEALHHRSQ